MLRFAIVLVSLLAFSPAQATEAGWALLREGGHVVLMRHAMAPGTGDPARFNIEDCATQRNLSERGRQQANRIGALLSARAARTERVLTSRYCRCADTARYAFEENRIEPFEPLDLPTGDEAHQKAQLEATMAEIRDFSGSGNLILVTHLENIQLLAGVRAREGEAIIIQPEGDGLRVIGRVLLN